MYDTNTNNYSRIDIMWYNVILTMTMQTYVSPKHSDVYLKYGVTHLLKRIAPYSRDETQTCYRW